MECGIIDPSPVQMQFTESESFSQLWFHFQTLLTEKQHLNVKLIGSNGHVKANRIILATFSPLFKLLLLTGSNHVCGLQEVLLPDFSISEISSLLEIIYAGEVICQSDNEVWRLKDLMCAVGIQNGRFTLSNVEAASDKKDSHLDDDYMIIDEETSEFEKQAVATVQSSQSEMSDTNNSDVIIVGDPTEIVHGCENKEKGSSSKSRTNLPELVHPPTKTVSPCVVPAVRGNVYSCSLCEKKYSQKSFLIVHEEEHKGTYPKKCNLCKFPTEFGSGPDFLFHIRAHTGEPRYICSICKNLFCTYSSLIVHKNENHV